MSRSNTAHSYGSVAKTFHWLTALLIITVIPLGIIANDIGYDTSEQLARKFLLFSLHKTVGVTIFFVALARIIWAINQPKPNGLHPERKAETWLAETIHWLLYGSLVMAPRRLDPPCCNHRFCPDLVALWSILAVCEQK